MCEKESWTQRRKIKTLWLCRSEQFLYMQPQRAMEGAASVKLDGSRFKAFICHTYIATVVMSMQILGHRLLQQCNTIKTDNIVKIV